MNPDARTRSKTWPILLAGAVVLPTVVLLAVLAFAWPAARIAPRGMPLGVVGASTASDQVVLALQQAEPGAFDLTLYGTDAAARQAIANREVYGALELTPGTPGKITALTASAASPTVAQLIDQVAGDLAQQSGAHGTPLSAASVDVVPSSPRDPRGLVLSSALLPLTICSVIFGAAIAVVWRVRSAWRQSTALAVLSCLGALSAYLIAQGFLGALPGRHLETLGSIALMMFAISTTVAGFVALFGRRGLGIGSVLLVFVGNPFSGVTSAPELLPKPVGLIGQLLPPGAGANLLRGVAYFDGHGPVAHLAVLIGWSVFGLLALVAGHHGFVGYAVGERRRPQAAAE